MRILVLSQWYPPEPQSVVSELAETLASQGHDVEVLTGFPNWPSGRLYPGYRVRLLQREVWNGITLHRVPLVPYHGPRAIGRLANFGTFCGSAMAIGPLVVRRPDLIHAIQPPTTCLPAWFLSRFWGVPFTYEVQDLWPDTLRATGMLGAGRALAMVDRYCRWTYRNAAAIRVISEGFRTELLDRGVPDAKIHVLPNWVDTDRFKPAASGQAAGRPQIFRIVYTGNLGLAQGMGNVIEAAARMPADAPIRWVLVGGGVEAEALRTQAARAGLTNVEFVSQRHPSEMPALLADADALLLHLKRDPLFSVTIPSKLLTYLAAGRPIVACIDGEAADIVRRAGAGLVCPPGAPDALAAAALQMANVPVDARTEMGRSGRQYACAHFEREAVVARIAAVLASVVAARSPVQESPIV